MITPNESVTWVPRNKPKDGPSHLPLLLLVGDGGGRIPPARQRVTTFTGTLVVGRREASQTEARQTSLVLADRMVSSQHMAIAPAPEEGTFEITDLSSPTSFAVIPRVTGAALVDAPQRRIRVDLHPSLDLTKRTRFVRRIWTASANATARCRVGWARRTVPAGKSLLAPIGGG